MNEHVKDLEETYLGKSVFNRKEKIYGKVIAVKSNGHLLIEQPEGRLQRLEVPASQIGNSRNSVHLLCWEDPSR